MRRRTAISTHSRPTGPLARLGIAALGLTLALTAPSAAHAADPLPLDGAYVVDDAGVLGSQVDSVLDSLDSLADAGTNLFVVIVDRFTGVSTSDSWAAATAELNRLGDRDILFAIAVDDRNFDVSYPESFALTEAQTDSLENDVAVPHLRDNDWAGALIAYADAMRDELNSAPTEPSEPGSSGGGIPINWPIVGGVVAVGGGAIYLYSRARKRKAVEASKLSQKELDQHASVLLVQLDDQIKTSEQDLQFATAEFGEKAIAPFSAALDGARHRLREAFEIRQKLDDAFPETDEERRTLTLRIVELCEAADAELDAQADAFDELRELEKNAPAALGTSSQDAATARARLDAARAKVTSLTATYSAAAVASIASNPDQATDLLDFADAQLSSAGESLASGETGETAVAVHTVQASLGQVAQLLDAIDGLDASLAEAAGSLAAVTAEVRADIAAARALPAGSDSRLEQTIVDVTAALDHADTKDPLTALATLQSVAAQLDTVLGAARERHERVQAATRSLDHALATARSEIAAANDYITTRRGGIGDSPRTRVSEAMRHLDAAVALAASDPVKALAEARAASGLAQNALSSAQSEVRAIQNSSNYGGHYGGGDTGGAILGGIIGSLLGGGGGGSSRPSSGTWGTSRTPWGSSSSSSSSRPRSGSFGGSSRRPTSSGSRGGRRSSGGRF